jgi:AcrR family transcriptional regulator
MDMALSKDDWVRAALFAIADGGAAAVAVEPLAARLGATKGSFYWHFRNREQLIAEALAFWEQSGTDDVIAALAPVADPVERLRRLLEIAIGYEDDDAAGQADVGLLAAAHDPVVGPVLRRVADKRLTSWSAASARSGSPPASPASGHGSSTAPSSAGSSSVASRRTARPSGASGRPTSARSSSSSSPGHRAATREPPAAVKATPSPLSIVVRKW